MKPPEFEPAQRFAMTASGRVAFTREVAHVLAEEVAAFELDVTPGRRIPDSDVEASLEARPLDVVFDRLEEHMPFDESHGWVMQPQAALDNKRPVELIAAGEVFLVLAHIEETFGPQP